MKRLGLKNKFKETKSSVILGRSKLIYVILNVIQTVLIVH